MTGSAQVVLGARNLVVVRESAARRFELSAPRLELRGGSSLAVIGPNGAGKTTLLLALAGLLKAHAGSLIGHGRRVTMVFQRPLPFAGSVAANVRVALLGKGLKKTEVEHRVDVELGRFGLRDLREQSAHRLSGGELRRLALARAMALSPTALLLDEPFDDLDVEAQSRLATDLRRLVRDTGVALVVVTHDLRRATGLADRLAVLRCGRLEQIGPTREVLEQPVSAEVARLVGMTNVLPGIVAFQDPQGGSRVEVDVGGSLHSSRTLDEGAEVWVGFRPEQLRVDEEQGNGTPIGEAEVVALEADSLLTQATLRWKGVDLETHLFSGRGRSKALVVGDLVRLSLQPDAVHLMLRGPEPTTAPPLQDLSRRRRSRSDS